MTATPTPPPADPPPPAADETVQKAKFHAWLDEWATAREAKNPPKRTNTGDSGGRDIFRTLFGG